MISCCINLNGASITMIRSAAILSVISPRIGARRLCERSEKTTRRTGRESLYVGFTIVEMALVLTVLALLAAGGLSFMSGRFSDERLRITKARMDAVMDAVETYIRFTQSEANAHLPCPANGALAYNHASFGDGTGTDAGAVNCSAANESYAATSGDIVAGAVPVNQLGISPIYMEDGWNRKFLYVVDEKLTNDASYGTSTNIGRIILMSECFNPAASAESQWAKSLIVRRSAGTIQDPSVVVTAPYNEPYGAALMLVSFGENGHGAWKGKGNATRIDAYDGSEEVYELEEENAHKDVTPFNDVFVQAPLNVNVDPASPTSGYVPSCRTNTYYFDDIIRYRTKWQLERL